MKIGATSFDGDFSWPRGIDTFTVPAELQPGAAANAINVSRAGATGAWAHRPAYLLARFVWEAQSDSKSWAESGPLQGVGCAYDSDTHYVVKGGHVYSFTPTTWGSLQARRVTQAPLLRPAGRAWVSGVPGGAICNDGVNLPVFAHARSASQSGQRSSSLRIGEAGVYTQGRFFYVMRGGTTILASDIDNPFSMQEALDTNVWGWESPDGADQIVALTQHRVLNTTVAVGNLAFSTTNGIFTVDTRGDRQSWGASQLGRVSEMLPGVSICGPRAVASVNSNLLFVANQPGLNLCMLNQLASQFERADSLSDQFLEADEWFVPDGMSFREATVVAAHGSRVLVTAGPRVAAGGHVFHEWVLAFEAVRGTNEGLRFQGAWRGPRVLDISTATAGVHRGMLFWGLTDDGQVACWSMQPGFSCDLSHRGVPVPIRSAVLTRGYTHTAPFTPKSPQGTALYFTNVRSALSVEIAQRTSGSNMWSAVRTRTVDATSNGAAVGPVPMGVPTLHGDTRGLPAGEFYAEQVLVTWTGDAALSGVGSSAVWQATGSLDAGETKVPFDPLCVGNYDPLSATVERALTPFDSNYL